MNDVGAAFLAASVEGLEKARVKIKHCLDQITDEQLWWRANPEMNSMANILLHLAGNLRQWIVSGIGGAQDVRDRPLEFSDRSGRSKDQIWSVFKNTLEEAQAALRAADPTRLLETRTIQGYQVSEMKAIFDTTAHLQGHMQEIISMTRQLLGGAYRVHYTPPALR